MCKFHLLALDIQICIDETCRSCPTRINRSFGIDEPGRRTLECEPAHTDPRHQSIGGSRWRTGAGAHTPWGYPTQIGARLAEIGERIHQEAVQANQTLKQWQQGYNYEIRIGIGPMLQHHILDPYLETLKSDRHHIIHFITGSASYLLPELQRGKLDLLVAASNLEINQSRLHRQIVFHDEVRVLAGRRSKFFGHKEALDLGELHDQNWILSGASSGIADLIGTSAPITQPGMIFTGAIGMVCRLLNTSDIIVRMPVRLMMLAGEITQDHIINVQDYSAPRNIAIWSSETALENPAVTKIKNELTDFFIRLDANVPWAD